MIVDPISYKVDYFIRIAIGLLRRTMNKPFEAQKQYAEFLKFIGVVEEDYVWSTRHLRWFKKRRENE